MNFERIDHVVWAVKDLNAALDQLEVQLGCRPVVGGVHPGRGTKNALLKIGKKQYLEILAPDENQEVDERWMGLDFISEPCVVRWCLGSIDWEKDLSVLRVFNSQLAQSGKGDRQRPDGSNLQWKMSYPLSTPEVEIAPFLIQWDSIHPCDSLPQDCSIAEIHFTSQMADVYQKLFDQWELGITVGSGPKNSISLVLQSPNGLVKL